MRLTEATTGTMTLPKLDGVEIHPGVFLIGEPTPVAGTSLLRCLANAFGSLVLIELKISFGRAALAQSVEKK
jgi:hypothetical protein